VEDVAFHLFLAVVLGFTALPLGRGTQYATTPESGGAAVSVVASHPLIRASLDRLAEGSPSWRAGLRHIRGRGLVVIVTPDEVWVQDGNRRRPFEADLLGEVTPVAEPDGRVTQVLVVVNVPLIEESHGRRFSTLSELHADLDRILAHEVFGHALPYLMVGNVSAHCADPRPGERAENACAIRRENVIRSELGLGRRTDAGLYGLALTRRSRF
jgi:hypothetical protein